LACCRAAARVDDALYGPADACGLVCDCGSVGPNGEKKRAHLVVKFARHVTALVVLQ
jgi:hypothetical protein